MITLRTLLVIGLLAPAGGVMAGEATPPPPALSTNPVVMFSTSHRFVVLGFGAADGAAIGQWTEEVARRLEGLVGAPIPTGLATPLEVTLGVETNTAPGRVIKSQGFIDGRVHQRLALIDPRSVDQEDMLEGLCWLLLNRYVAARQDDAQRTSHLGTVPDWLSVGAAQSLYPELRARNARMILSSWRQGQSYPIHSVMDLIYLPEGRWNEKPLSGMFVNWLASLPDAAKRWGAMFDHLATGRRIDEPWLATATGLPSARDMSKAWDVWLAAQQEVQYEWGKGPDQCLADLKRMLEIKPDDYGVVVERDVPSSLTAAQLIEYRKRKWIDALTERLELKLQWLALGQPPELQDVFRNYVAFLDAVAARAPVYRGGLFGRGPSLDHLRKILAQADASLAEYERDADKRSKYLDTVTARFSDDGAATWPRLPAQPSDPQDAARKKYLDQLEQKLPK